LDGVWDFHVSTVGIPLKRNREPKIENRADIGIFRLKVFPASPAGPNDFEYRTLQMKNP
jgi:hypothetical protein